MNLANPYLIPFLRRLAILFIISIAATLLVSEITFRVMGNDLSRGPEKVSIVIPPGTAAKIAAGEPSGIPDGMTFVLGDELVVENQDSANHILGPLFIPAGQSASMRLEDVSDMAYECSFQTARYFGLTVKEAITWRSRLSAAWYGAMPTLMLLLVYSLVAKPLKPMAEVK